MSQPELTMDSVEWRLLHEHLAALARTADEGPSISFADAQEVLQKRARKLAEVVPSTPAGDESVDVVVFVLGDERYAIETDCVREVLPVPAIEALPGAPEFVAGVMNLHGDIHVVFDLLRFFGWEPQTSAAHRCVLVFGRERIEFGIVVQSVEGVEILPAREILEAPAFVSGIAREYIRGVTPNALTVLDASRLRSDGRLYLKSDREIPA